VIGREGEEMVEIRALAMETVVETAERESQDADEHHRRGRGSATRISRPGVRVLGRWCRFSPLMRSWWVRVLCLLCAATMVVVVGVVVYRNTLSNKRKELELKCENRKEVSPPPLPLSHISSLSNPCVLRLTRAKLKSHKPGLIFSPNLTA
jgi:hypothetical protein